MTNNSIKSKDRKSLCEESMLVFVNILKLSSLSLARRTLVTNSDEENDDVNQKVPNPNTIYNNHKAVVHHSTPSLVPMQEPHKRKRSQKPEPPPESKLSYVMLPNNHDETTSTATAATTAAVVDGQFSEYIRRFHEKADNDLQNAKAANYIKRFHEKNMKDLNNESMRRGSYVLPPPPHRQVFE